MMKQISKKAKKTLAFTLAAVSLFASGGVLVSALADVDVRDNFNFPDAIDKVGVVGEKTEIARIMPADDMAEDYRFTVLYDGKEVQTDGYSFFPEKAGGYTCLYYYEAEGKTYEYSYVINAQIKNTPVFSNDLYLPTAFIAGKTYELPVVEAADWSNGKTEAKVTQQVLVNGQEMPVENGVLTVDTVGSSTATVRYTATANGKSEVLETSVPVVDINKTVGGKSVIDMAELFVTRGFDGSSVYTEKNNSGKDVPRAINFSALVDAEAKFANVLGANLDLDLGFGTACSAQSIVVKIEALEDPSVYLTLEFNKGNQDEGKGKVILNGGLSKMFDFTKEGKISLTLDSAAKKFKSGSSELFAITTDANGGEFKGFPGNRVKLSVALKGVYGGADLRIYKINNQVLGGDSDTASPILFKSDFHREYSAGQVVKVFDRFAIDVIDPTAVVKTSVYYNGTEPVVDVDGQVVSNVLNNKEIAFLANKSGNYTVMCFLQDSAGKKSDESNLLFVYDVTPPTLEVKGEVQSVVAVGEKINLPKASATDNDGVENVLLQVCVLTPSARYIQVAFATGVDFEGTTCAEFTEAGEYKVRYIATDNYGNYTVKEFAVTCGG